MANLVHHSILYKHTPILPRYPDNGAKVQTGLRVVASASLAATSEEFMAVCGEYSTVG
jgi:hypothetical protein